MPPSSRWVSLTTGAQIRVDEITGSLGVLDPHRNWGACKWNPKPQDSGVVVLRRGTWCLQSRSLYVGTEAGGHLEAG